MKVLVKNVNIVTPYEIIYGHGVLIEKGVIKRIDKEENFKRGNVDNVIDGQHNFLAPGFIDIHNHGNSGYDFMDSTEEAIDNIADFHLQNGVTSFLGTIITSSYEDMKKAIQNIVDYKNKEIKSKIIGIHLEGPFFSMEKKGAQPAKHIKGPDLNEIKELEELSNGMLKVVSIAPELEGASSVIRYLKSKNIISAMAHSNATFEQAKKGVHEGITLATHLYNGMRSFSHREPGIIGVSLTDDRVYCEIIYDRIHLHDGSVDIALRTKGVEKIILVSDAMRAAGLDDGEYELGGQKVLVKKGEARLESGALAGSTLNLRDAVYNMVYKKNVPIHEAVRMASLNSAKAIGVDNKKGSIEVGKDADLILFDREINILASMVGGKTIWLKN